MKTSKVLLAVVLVGTLLTSCSSVRVAADYDKEANFGKYKSFAFYKPGIDKAEISDLDKKRILRAIQNELVARGYTKSESPDILVSIFTKERDRVDVWNNNFGWGWGWGWGGGWWNPWWGGGWGGNTVTTRTEGSLYIDLIDAQQKELVWQGKGTGYLITSEKMEKKEAKIQEFVREILAKFPPQQAVQ